MTARATGTRYRSIDLNLSYLNTVRSVVAMDIFEFSKIDRIPKLLTAQLRAKSDLQAKETHQEKNFAKIKEYLICAFFIMNKATWIHH